MPDAISPRILIADDHALIRDGLKTVLRLISPAARCEEVGTAREAVAAVEGAPWDLVVLDLGLPEGDEFATLRRLRRVRPAMPILVFSMFSEERMGRSALAAGASGYLCKTADRALIGAAIAETLAGRGYVSKRLAESLERQPGLSEGAASVLSAREWEVLLALGRGLSSKEIAAHLGVGVSSVGTYRMRVMEKLSLRTTADLQRYIVDHRLVQG